MLRGITRHLIIEALILLIMLISAIWLIIVVSSCSSNTKHTIAQDYYICSNAKGN